MRKLPRKPCPICNKKPKRPDTIYCSIKCRAVTQKDKRIGGPKIIHLPRPCLFCNKIFKPRRATQVFCSKKCFGKSNINNSIEKGFTTKGRKLSKEQCKQISERAKKLYQGKNNPNYGKKAAHGKGQWHISWENKKFWLRSSWEYKYALYLDKNKISYEVEPKAFEIKYSFQNQIKEGTYTPDFYLINNNKYIEIKGYWRDDAKNKYNAFTNQYKDINIEIYNKEKLLKLGVL